MSNEREQRAARAEQMRKDRERSDRRQRNLISVAIVVVVAALIALAAWAYYSVKPNYETDVIAPKNTTDDYGIVYDWEVAGGKKPAKEPIVIDLYEDFQCPACLQFEQSSGALLKASVKSGEITIVYHPFSFLDERGMSLNDYSKRSTNVAMAVLDKAGVAKYVQFHEYLYANQPPEQTEGPEDAALIAAAKDLGVTGIDEAVKNRKFFPWIEKAREAGTKRGVTGTPGVFVDGKQLESGSAAAISEALEAAKAKRDGE